MAEQELRVTAEDIEYAQACGLPVGLRKDLVGEHAGQLVFTVKGLACYRAACLYHGVLADFRAVRSAADLRALALKVAENLANESFAQLEASWHAGQVAPQDAELTRALLYGTMDDVVNAAERQASFAEAGANVIAGCFNRNWAAARSSSPV